MSEVTGLRLVKTCWDHPNVGWLPRYEIRRNDAVLLLEKDCSGSDESDLMDFIFKGLELAGAGVEFDPVAAQQQQLDVTP